MAISYIAFICAGVGAFVVANLLGIGRRKKIHGVYTRPNLLTPIKAWLFYWVLMHRKKKNAKTASASSDTAGYGMKSRNSTEEMDRAQVLPPEHPKAVDAVYFNSGNLDGYYFVAATARRHNGLIQTLLYIRIPGLGILRMPHLPDAGIFTKAEMEYSVNGLEINVIEAMKTWSIKYKGKLILTKLDGSTKEVKANFDLLWEATSPLFDFDTDLDVKAMAKSIALEPWNKNFFNNLREAHQTHYEQFGRITGDVNIKGKTDSSYHLDVIGVRDHSYGNIREWSDLHRYAIQYATLEDGTQLCIGNICMKPTMTRLVIGYVFHPDGSMDTVSWTDLELYKSGEDGIDPDDISFKFRAGGKNYDVDLHVEDRVIFYMGDQWEARIHERFSTYNVNGVKGYGISEWDYNYHGGKGNVFKR